MQREMTYVFDECHDLYHVQSCAEKKDCFAKDQPGVGGCGWLQLGRNFLSTQLHFFCSTLYAHPPSPLGFALHYSYTIYLYSEQPALILHEAEHNSFVEIKRKFKGLGSQFEISLVCKASTVLCSSCTAYGHRIAHRKWKDTKLQPGTAGPGKRLGCCLVSFHFLWTILCPQAVDQTCRQACMNQRGA